MDAITRMEQDRKARIQFAAAFCALAIVGFVVLALVTDQGDSAPYCIEVYEQ